jgi:1-acyl-sn-glycerol-3-phosphate acyltransferase
MRNTFSPIRITGTRYTDIKKFLSAACRGAGITNHQSYIDPLLVCSVYPRRVIGNIFHVGASMYFANFVMAQFARLINVVPIDPDVQLLRAMRAGAAGLRAGKILNIYPEGQRAPPQPGCPAGDPGLVWRTAPRVQEGRRDSGDRIERARSAGCFGRSWSHLAAQVAVSRLLTFCLRLRLAKVKISFGEPIDARTVAPNETDEEVVYEKVTAVLKQRAIVAGHS